MLLNGSELDLIMQLPDSWVYFIFNGKKDKEICETIKNVGKTVG